VVEGGLEEKLLELRALSMDQSKNRYREALNKFF
jgi:hypothetical protein